MTVGELRAIISDVPDDMKIFTVFGDHEAREVEVFEDSVVYNSRLHRHFQFFGDEFLTEDEVGVPALIVE